MIKNMKAMNVLSLFDGMSCGQIALNKAGIKYDNYYASEIDEYAIEIAKKNYPNTVHVGDVTKLDTSTLPQIDLLIGGSPCQSFSSLGDGSGLDGKSGLFWDFIRVFKEVKPKYFLLENVSMKREWLDIISYEMGVEPREFNSRLVSAQNRKRLYWTNIPFSIPFDNEIKFTDVLEDLPFRELKPFMLKDWGGKPRIDKGVNWICNDKSVCLTTSAHHPNQYLLNEDRTMMRTLSVDEYERIQTIPQGYTEGVSNTQRYKMIGNGWTVNVIEHIFQNIK
jgi:site-specific DNA-cytosine methylase